MFYYAVAPRFIEIISDSLFKYKLCHQADQGPHRRRKAIWNGSGFFKKTQSLFGKEIQRKPDLPD